MFVPSGWSHGSLAFVSEPEQRPPDRTSTLQKLSCSVTLLSLDISCDGILILLANNPDDDAVAQLLWALCHFLLFASCMQMDRTSLEQSIAIICTLAHYKSNVWVGIQWSKKYHVYVIKVQHCTMLSLPQITKLWPRSVTLRAHWCLKLRAFGRQKPIYEYNCGQRSLTLESISLQILLQLGTWFHSWVPNERKWALLASLVLQQLTFLDCLSAANGHWTLRQQMATAKQRL